MSGLHRHEIQELLGGLKKQVKKATEDELEASQSTSLSIRSPDLGALVLSTRSSLAGLSTKESPTMRQQSIRRAGTLVRSPLETGKKDKDKDGKMPASEVSSEISFL